MPNNTLTLANLITAVRRRADMVGSTFVSDAEIVDYINVAMAELHDILVTKFEDYYVKEETYTLPATSPTSLPSSFYKALGVDLDVGGVTYRLRSYSFQERATYNSPGIIAATITNTMYHIQGNLIKFIPDPTVSGTATLFYVPEVTRFDAGSTSDTIVGKAPQVVSGYEEYVVIDAAIKCLQKEESDVQVLLVQKQQQIQRIEQAAGKRDAGESYAITDVSVGTTSYLDDYIRLVR
jgi:hypothetical protein|tara:strand:+ start:2040 stop:2750 length:711 start_codon:yes stop_codon:yes gene_type:complete